MQADLWVLGSGIETSLRNSGGRHAIRVFSSSLKVNRYGYLSTQASAKASCGGLWGRNFASPGGEAVVVLECREKVAALRRRGDSQRLFCCKQNDSVGKLPVPFR